MPSRMSPQVRRFRNVARQRFEDAEFLIDKERSKGAVYLAGYGVECILKALLLSRYPLARQHKIAELFRGGKGHNLEWLKDELRRQSVNLPDRLAKEFTTVRQWSTELRYEPGPMSLREAEAFMSATAKIIQWAEGSF